MYSVVKTCIGKQHCLYDYCSKMTALSKSLYNAALFRLRNYFTAYNKSVITPLEQEVVDEFALLPTPVKGSLVSYYSLERVMRLTHNPDFFAALPKQSAQSMVRKAVQDGNLDEGSFLCGAIAGMITEIKPCKDIVEEMFAQAEALLSK